MKFSTQFGFLLGFAALSMAALAQDAGSDPHGGTRDIVQFSVASTTSAPADELRILLRVTREDSDAGRLQRDLQTVLDGALAQARPQAERGLLDLRTGSFGLSPRRGADGRLTGWQGSAELTLSGTAMDRIAALAARLAPASGATAGGSPGGGLVVVAVEPRLSTSLRERLETEARADAIRRFRAQAADLAQQFGYARYALREVSVSAAAVGGPQPRLMMAAAMSGPGPIPVEAGLSEVSASVSGSIQLLH